MPCYQERTQTVDIKNVHPDVLTDALKADGWHSISTNASYVIAYKGNARLLWEKGGTLRVTGVSSVENDAHAKSVTKAYTRAAFTRAATKAGFRVREHQGKLVAEKRRYATVRR